MTLTARRGRGSVTMTASDFTAATDYCVSDSFELPASSTQGIAPAPTATVMTPAERRARLSLAFIFALRMLGRFLVLPVFALEARKYPGGDDTAAVGLAMGIYGLTQAFLQMPYGMASDRLGRKRVIVERKRVV